MSDSRNGPGKNLTAAREALRRQNYAAARRFFRRSLDEEDELDYEAQIELGIAELLDGDEQAFEETYHRLEIALCEQESLNSRLESLWRTFQRLFVKMRRAAAAVTLISVPVGCGACDGASEPTTEPMTPLTTEQQQAPEKSPTTVLPNTPPAVADDESQSPPTTEAGPASSTPDAGTTGTPPGSVQPQKQPPQKNWPRRTRYRVARPRHLFPKKGE